MEALLQKMRMKEQKQKAAAEMKRMKDLNAKQETEMKKRSHQQHVERKAAIKMKLFQPSVTTGNNRTSTEAALRTLSAQIRSNIKRELKETDHLAKELARLKQQPRERVVQMHIKEIEGELAKHPRSIREVFERLDVDGNGALDKHEFMDGLMHMNVALNDHEFELLFSFMDSNEDGVLEYHEFEPLIRTDDIKEQQPNTGPPTLYAGHRKISNLGLRKPSIVRRMQESTHQQRKTRIQRRTVMINSSTGKPVAAHQPTLPKSNNSCESPPATPAPKRKHHHSRPLGGLADSSFGSSTPRNQGLMLSPLRSKSSKDSHQYKILPVQGFAKPNRSPTPAWQQTLRTPMRPPMQWAGIPWAQKGPRGVRVDRGCASSKLWI